MQLYVVFLLVFCSTFLLPCPCGRAEVPDPSKLQMEEWASNGMTQDPVALAFDHQGRLYVVETARRSTVDIDIRSHRDWLLEDLANDDFESMRAFFRRRMSPQLSAQNKKWLEDRNGDGIHDFRDLTTISERIRLIEDTDKDGKADRSTLYADGFQQEFTGVAAGVMPYQGDVLMTVYPDLWRLRDLDGDGKADGRVRMFRGFGVHAAFDGHDLHGLTIGPEGKIYFSCGDNGFSVVTQEGERLHYPNTGGVLRMNPDGSELEVFAYGLRNVQEFDFDQFGNMFGVDNDGDLEDERERAVYIAEGSDSGWRLNWQFRSEGWKRHNGGMTYNPWTAEGMWKPQHAEQPAHITPPMNNYSVGPGGFKFNPGTALNDEYRNFFFCVQFPVQKITAFRTEPQGAGFEMVDEHTFHSGLMVSSLNFGPDGGFYLADWIGKWQPNGEGVIYRIDDPNHSPSVRYEVQQYLRGGVDAESDPQLLKLLGHPDRRVRQLAQFELVRRQRSESLLRHAQNTEARQLGRIHALWGLIQLAQSPDDLASSLPWDDPDPQIRQQCSRVAGDLRLPHSEEHLITQLQDPVSLVRSHAAIALGKVGSQRCIAGLVQLLRENSDRDPFIRHAAVMGLAGALDTLPTEYINHESSSVRLGMVLALTRKRSPEVAEYLSDPDLRVLREAVRGIHDDHSIPQALAKLAALLERQELPRDEPTIRRILSANLRVGNAAAARRLVDFVMRDHELGHLADPLKLEALACLSKWKQTPLVDRVEGRIRTSARLDGDAAHNVVAASLDQILSVSDAQIASAVISTANDLAVPIDRSRRLAWVKSNDISMSVRVDSLNRFASEDSPEAQTLIEQILDEKLGASGTPLWQAAFALQVERNPEEAWSRIDWTDATESKQFYVSMLPHFEMQEAKTLLNKLLQKEAEGRGDRGDHIGCACCCTCGEAARRTLGTPSAPDSVTPIRRASIRGLRWKLRTGRVGLSNTCECSVYSMSQRWR